MTAPARAEARLVVEDLDFAYGSATDAYRVTGWSEHFPAGATTAVTGPSGCGKSTRLYLLGLMLTPTRGRLLLDGHDVTALPDARRAELRATRYGFVFQDAALDPTRTVLDNIVETALYRGADARDWHDRAQALLDEFGVTVPARRRPGQVSGGQAQRIALCRALIGRPDVILADEPTGNLDPASTRVVVDALQREADQGACVVIVTHDPALASGCDRTVHLQAPA